MFDPKHYVPILQAKRGELTALRELPAATLASMTPLLEVPPVAWDWAEDGPAKSLDAHLTATAAAIRRGWTGNAVLYVDQTTDAIELSERLANNDHPYATLLGHLRQSGVHVIPVTGPDRDAAYDTAVRNAAAEDHQGACIRVGIDQFNFLTDAAAIAALLAAINLPRASVDLVIDLANVTTATAPALSIAVSAVLQQPTVIPAGWRTIIVASGGFPQSMAGMAVGVHALRRCDLELWLQTCQRLPAGVQRPRFSDYAIQAPGLAEVDPRTMQMSANIRYATPTDWLVVRGRFITGRNRVGFGEYQVLCQTLIARPEFRGPAFSPGDQYIAQCAAGQSSPGNPEIWRRQGTSHHLATVADQFATLIVP